ncbi:YkyA family protein [Risungbinella massiliensis]|uniref:YkyA family protein n=1 Tax=Risungbinella massiliensis TaxID=1329796 RepID=UPI0005CC6113|nr:YkyA family protein [Risungbinella massiliensis]
MKKLLMVFAAVLVLSGCSLFADYYNAGVLADEMNKAVLALNKNSEASDKIDTLYGEINTLSESMNEPNQQVLDQINTKLTEIRKISTDYKAELERVSKQVPDFQAKSAKLEDPEIKQLAETFLADFKTSIDAELNFAAGYEKMITTDETAFKAIAEGKEPPSDAVYDQLNTELTTLNDKLKQTIDQFNKSWDEFSRKATGTGVE